MKKIVKATFFVAILGATSLFAMGTSTVCEKCNCKTECTVESCKDTCDKDCKSVCEQNCATTCKQ